jgi:hypothetical protein
LLLRILQELERQQEQEERKAAAADELIVKGPPAGAAQENTQVSAGPAAAAFGCGSFACHNYYFSFFFCKQMSASSWAECYLCVPCLQSGRLKAVSGSAGLGGAG